ncbi:MAG: ATP-binding protein [Bdellovibrionales bacterium]
MFITSFRFRLTALFVIIFGTTLIGFSVVLYRSYKVSHQADFDATLYNYAVDLSQAIDIGGYGDVELRGQMLKDKIFPFPLGKAFLQIRTLEGEIIARSVTLGESELPISTRELSELAYGQIIYRSLYELGVDKKEPFRLLNFTIHQPPVPKLVLQIAVPTTLLDRQMSSLFTFFVTSIPFVLVLAAIGGYYFSGRALIPVREIINKAKEISATDLSVRVPVPAAQDELHELAVTLNSLLDRLKQAFDSQDQFVSNASHQLKTPLAIMRGELDLILKKERSTEEINDFLQSAHDELSHLSKIIEDLLLIARMDSGQKSFVLGKVQVDEAIVSAIARLEKIAKKKNVGIKLQYQDSEQDLREFLVSGDQDLLQSMFYNLIENALKYSHERQTIQISVGTEGDRIVTRISDKGVGISEDDQKKLFARFSRGADQRAQIPGVGLGLAIAKQIAHLHGGFLDLEKSNTDGTTFRFEIKKV